MTVAQKVVLTAEGVREIDQLFEQAIQKSEVPAVEAIVVSKNEVLYHSAFGKRNAGNDIDLQIGDLFDVASMTKPFTSAAAMNLIEKGTIELDDPVTRYLPEIRKLRVLNSFNETDTTFTSSPPDNPILIRHLLSQTSGMGYPWFYEPLQLLYQKQGGSGFTFIYDYLSLPLLYEPGSGWSYGISAQVLGTIIETISGMDLDSFFEEHIFIPLGMRNTFYRVPIEKLDRRVTLQIRDENGWTEQSLPDKPEVLIIGDATVISTGADYARFIQMLLNGGTLEGNRILSENAVNLMTQNQIGELYVKELFNGFPAGAGRDKFGFGFRITTDQIDPCLRSSDSYSWAGSNNTFFWVDPVREIGAVLLMHYLPFNDKTAQRLLNEFERRVYDNLD